MITTIRLPFDSGRAATWSAAHSAAPQEMPASRPARRAQVQAVWIASSSDTAITSASSSRLSTSGTKPGADALDPVRAGTRAGEDRRAGRLDRDDLKLGVALAQVFARAGDRAAGADAGDEHVDAAVERALDLRPGPTSVDGRVGWVGELVGQEHVGVLRHRAGGRDGLRHPPERLGDVDARPVETQQALALAAHPLGQGQHQLIAPRRADECKRDPGIAGGGLDDRRAPRLDQALGLGRLDHRYADPVLDGAARVERLELGEELHPLGRAGALEHRRQPHQGRVPDKLCNVDRDLGHPPPRIVARDGGGCNDRARPHPRPSSSSPDSR